jgi:acyl carrier protein
MQSVPVSNAQRNMWIAEKIGAAGPALHTVEALEFSDDIEPAAFRRAVQEIVRRHAVLRTTVAMVDGVLEQRIHEDADISVPIITITAPDVAAEDGAAAPGHWLHHPAVHRLVDDPFHLATQYPVRAAVCRLPGGVSGAVVVVHHIASDMASAQIMLDELAALYGAFARGEPSPLPDPVRQYADLAIRDHASADEAAEHVRYWTKQLADLPAPIDLARPNRRPQIPGTRAASLRCSLPDALVRDVAEFARAEQVTVFAVAMAAYYVALTVVGGERDLLVAVPNLQREDEESEKLIGCFLHMLPLRAVVIDGSRVREFVQTIWAGMIEALEHRALPFDKIAEIIEAPCGSGFHPLTQVGFTMAGVPTRERTFGPVRATSLCVERESITYDLMANLQTTPRSMDLTLEYRVDIVPRPTVERMARVYPDVLRLMSVDPTRPLGTVLEEAGFDPAARRERPARGSGSPEPADAADSSATGLDPDVTARLAAIWKEILEVDEVDTADAFYTRGGRSLAMIKLVLRIVETFDADLPISAVLQAPTLADQSRLISRLRQSG